ncbi:hypothetical protein BUALT_Bualt16G0080700 [Buddleja alternifolia]|uniref:SWIM-type domain-containing protein n=1 Tax=Buddleja alternifolia TaxID=168488 RepID=A0AAV6WKT3_9LAMI|nr:hypothetical protein BUALT_Bualt16G0080700 [Buddleja alternifolia]
MVTGAADFMFRCVFDGSLSMSDMNIERRPYHKNCKCALHKVKGKCSHTGSRQRNISFPTKELRTNCSLSVSASIASSQSSYFENSSFRSTECIHKVQFSCLLAFHTQTELRKCAL